MAMKLPGAEDLGQAPSGRSGKPIASYDTTAIGRGAAQLGAGIASMAGDLARVAATKNTTVDQATRFETQRRFLEFSAREDDELQKAGQSAKPGAFGFREGFQESYKERAKEFFATVPEELKPEYDVRLFQAEDGLAGRALTFERDQRKSYYTNTVNDGLVQIENKLYQNPAAFDANLSEGNSFIDNIPDDDVSPIAKEEMRRQWKKKAQVAALNGLPPTARMEALGAPAAASGPLPSDVQGRATRARDRLVARGWSPVQAAGVVGHLVQESGVRADGPSGDNGTASGMAQWRGERLTRLQRFAAAQGKDWRDFDTQVDYIDMELRNHETEAGKRLQASTTVEQAVEAFMGYERPAGWSPGNPRGGHGWSNRLAAAQRTAGVDVSVPMTGGDVDPRFADMPWDERETIVKGAETEQRQAAADARISAQFAIESALTNAPAALQNTGKYDGTMPTQDQFIAAYGDQAMQKWKEFQATVETSQQAFRMQTMPADEIKALVEAAQPSSSGDGAALEQERYKALSGAAEQTLKARDADPAAYARRVFPNVETTWRGAGSTPEAYRDAVAMSIAAQEQLGVTKIMPLPKDASNYVVDGFKDKNASENERIAAVATAINSTPDPEQRRAIFQQLVDAGLPDMTEGAIEALSRGDEGAARRLFQAAMLDPSEMPGKLPVKPAEINEAVEGAIMGEGMIGDIYYGLSDGSAENFVRAERDAKLINNAVMLRLRNGEDINTAVAGVAKDLYGDVQVLSGDGRVNAQILVPADQDADAIVDGLAALSPAVREAVSRQVAVPADAPTADGTKAILDAATSNYVENVMAEGYFRNADGGFVFIDPYVGAAVADAKGNPVIFTTEQALAARHKRDFRSPEAPLTDDAFDRFQQRMGQ